MVYYIVDGKRVDPNGNPVEDAGPVQAGPVLSLDIPGLSPEQIDALQEAGYTDTNTLADAMTDELIAVETIGPAAVRRIRKWLES